MTRRLHLGIAGFVIACCFALAAGLAAQQSPSLSPEFTPVFDGRSLAGWTPKGGAWKVDQGEILGSGTGWLTLNNKFEDGRVVFWFKCASCNTGLLLRGAERDGRTTGLFVSLAPGDPGTTSVVTLDATGAEVDRKPVTRQAAAPAGGGAAQAAAAPAGGRGGGRGGGAAAAAPKPTIHPSVWNYVELAIHAGVLTGTINGITIPGGGRGAQDPMVGLSNFGFAALKAPGTEIRFRGLALEDSFARKMATDKVGTGFEMRRVTDQFYSETSGIGDFNNDGKIDVAGGPIWYEGPAFNVAHFITRATTANASGDYPLWGDTAVFDFNGDGWADMASQPRVNGQFSITVYLNPKGESRAWDQIIVAPQTTAESMPFCVLLKDGRYLPITLIDGRLGYFTYDKADVKKPWVFNTVSDPSAPPVAHGLDCGDVNKDGRLDLLNGRGWWEQPAQLAAAWTFHAAPFDFFREGARNGGGAEMLVYDVNDDGRMDVVTALAAHSYGLGWFEQKADGSWLKHIIMSEPMTAEGEKVPPISELHGMAYADLDGDGLTDIIAGKRWWSHGDLYNEMGFQAPATLYWFKLTRNNGQATFTPQIIHDNSGIGTGFAVGDVDGDGKPDIVTAARHGVYIFYNRLGARR